MTSFKQLYHQYRTEPGNYSQQKSSKILQSLENWCLKIFKESDFQPEGLNINILSIFQTCI